MILPLPWTHLPGTFFLTDIGVLFDKIVAKREKETFNLTKLN